VLPRCWALFQRAERLHSTHCAASGQTAAGHRLPGGTHSLFTNGDAATWFGSIQL